MNSIEFCTELMLPAGWLPRVFLQRGPGRRR